MKKLTALFMALVMMMAMATTASAVEITISGATTDDTYEAYKVLDVEGTKDAIRYKADADWEDFINSYDGLVLADGYVSKENDFSAADFAAKVIAEGKTKDADSNNGKINLDNGYWVMFSPLGTPFAFTVIGNEISTGGTTITEKTGLPQITKTVNKATACIGEELTYTITVAAAHGVDTYTITDEVPAEIDIVGTPTATCAGDPVTVTVADNTISLTIDGETRKNLKDDDKIVITYTAKLNTNAVIEGEGNKNNVTLEYGVGLKKEDSAVVKTYQFELEKTDGTNILPGAVFQLKLGDTVVKLAYDGTKYYPDAINGVETLTAGATTVVGLGNGTYTLTETEAPDGYIKASESKTITINNANAEKVTVVNTPGQLLPETGGIGTTVFYMGGIVLMLAGAVVLTKKRRNA